MSFCAIIVKYLKAFMIKYQNIEKNTFYRYDTYTHHEGKIMKYANTNANV